MKVRWRIREKLFASTLILVVAVSVLAYSSFQGAGRFRAVTKTIRDRSNGLPLSANLAQKVAQLRVAFLRYSMFKQIELETGGSPGKVGPTVNGFLDDEISLRQRFLFDLEQVDSALGEYENHLKGIDDDGKLLSDIHREVVLVDELKAILANIARDFAQTDWIFTSRNRLTLEQELSTLQEQVALLPGFLGQRMNAFHEQARSEYKTWMFVSGVMTFAAIGILGLLFLGIYFMLLRPLRELIRGSKIVADGDFDHRIRVSSRDEVADLAAAMNLMTENFQQIRNGLDEQVRRRTREAIRSDRLASVGFLAAGVAHEINNPLASIAWSAESVERRFNDAFEVDDATDENDPDVEFIRKYLARIQQESFRCKGITERLLDFSRVGESERKPFDLTALVQGVIDMVENLKRYREKRIHFDRKEPLMVEVNGQEFKQVIMNLLTNALDCVGSQGNVWIDLDKRMGHAVLTVRDDGIGMSQDVLEHVFEPFFTKRKHGEGTGLGLSISHQIIADHGGTITAYSEGRNRGSQFEINLPFRQNRQPESGNSSERRNGEPTGNDQEEEKRKPSTAA